MRRHNALRSFLALSFVGVFAGSSLHASQDAPPPPQQQQQQPAAKQPTGDAAPATQQRPRPRDRVKEVKDVFATFTTKDGGTFRVKLHVQETPTLAANFANLVRRGFFDGQAWKGHTRVTRQAGTELPLYSLPREFGPKLDFNAGGRLAYTKINEKTASPASGTRIFLTTKEQDRWNLDHQVFGQVVEGMDALQRIDPGATIEKVEVEGDVDALLKAFEPEVAEWNAALDAAKGTWIQREGPTQKGDPNWKPMATPVQPRNGDPAAPTTNPPANPRS